MSIHASIVSRAYGTLLSHPQCPPIGDDDEGVQGLAIAMEAALEAVQDDLAADALARVTDERDRARRWVVVWEQDAAEARRLLRALVEELLESEPSATAVELAIEAESFLDKGLQVRS